MITCRDFVEFLWAYVAGELPSDQRSEFDAHMAICPHCVNYLDSYAKTVRLEKAAFENLDEPVPTEMPEELVKAILAARGKGGR
ncbi:MAG TPA: zf-HC2 domain-containing protein [Candidatus Polarisedimenticolaceae bacterium]